MGARVAMGEVCGATVGGVWMGVEGRGCESVKV
jgi:hypothetical protein